MARLPAALRILAVAAAAAGLPPEAPPPPRACCAAETAACLACRQGVSVGDLCAGHPHTAGCWPVRACCSAPTAGCLACERGVSPEEYCAEHPDTAGCGAAPVVRATLARGSLRAGSYEPEGVPASPLSDASPRRLSRDACGEELFEYEEGEPIQMNWNLEHVGWSFLVSTIGAYVALTSAMIDVKSVRGSHWYWVLLAQAGCSLGVTSVWSMHFIGMYALELKSPGKPMVEIQFEPVLTIISGLAAWLIVCIALHLILGQDHFGDRRTLEKRLQGLSSCSKAGWLLRRLPLKRLTMASVLVSVGVVVMHYMGMLSQTGHFWMEFSAGNILGSMVVAGVASWIALPIFVISFDSMVFRFGASFGIGVFVNSMHYTGMTAATYYYSSNRGGVFGADTMSISLKSTDVVIFTLILDLVLMGFTGYYVELARELVKKEERDVERKLAFESHKNNVKSLIAESRIMSYPMCLMRYDTFSKLGKLVPHEQLRDTHKLVYLNTVRSVLRLKRRKYYIIFFWKSKTRHAHKSSMVRAGSLGRRQGGISADPRNPSRPPKVYVCVILCFSVFSHQWLSRMLPDPANDHYIDMMSALQGLAQMFKVRLDSLYIFVDYSSIPQQGQRVQKLAIDSLATYVSLSSAFVIVSPQTVHRDSSALCNFDTYSKRFWCRLEVFCTILASLREKELKAVEAGQILEEDEAQLEESAKVAEDETQQVASKMSELTQQQRVFVVVKNSLHALNFFTPAGELQPRYHDLLRLFEGQTTCCDQGHQEGDEQLCDKCRVIDSLTGAYGALLQDLRKAKRNQSRGIVSQVPSETLRLVEEIVRQRADIFPSKYFETRIDAVHARLDRGLVTGGSGDGDERMATAREDDEDRRSVDYTDDSSDTSSHASSEQSSAGLSNGLLRQESESGRESVNEV
ncbi:unnamed protein product [Prorocentrum cordatum]|uniref:MHYT domain-containing protein n=1 Tax=Prorocentrum cordatum TaxID=2364126 RepID=A0ABN9QTQ4_9DINO|nr:unnamed protein product [Polarella glacialis]